MKKLHLAVALLGLLATAVIPTAASAVSSYYTSQGCSGCHGATPTTCNGCHEHGPGGLTGSLSGTTFAPGQAFNVTVSSGTRSGWWKAAVLDASNNVVGQLSKTASGAAVIAVTAPTAPGNYTWKAAWYGNEYSGASGSTWVPDSGNSNHGYRTVNLSAFTVAAVVTPAPVAALSVSTLAFGSVVAGQSATLSANVTNTGNAALAVTRVTPCSNTAPPFALTPSAAFSVAAGGRQALSVSFAPSSSGAVTGCFDLATNDPAHATLRLTVTGTGTAVPTASASLTPAALAFGNVAVGQAAALTATVRNTGGAALSVTGVTPCDGSNATSLTVSPATAFAVPAGGSQTLSVRFAPTAAGGAAACWNITTSDAANPSLRLNASATGVAATPTAPVASLTPAALAFSSVAVGQAASMAATVRNTGTAALAVTAVAPCDGSNAASLTVSPVTAFSVAAGGSQALSVRFAPTAAGAAAACWNVATNDPANPSLQLRATGTGTTVTTPPTGSCTSCHAIPPATGRHAMHKSEGVGCRSCHGQGYSTTTVASATHANGKVNLSSRTGWRVSSRSCANSCHGSETWSSRSNDDDDDDDDEDGGRGDDDFVLIADEEPEASGGCSSAGGSGTLLAFFGLGLLGLLRRRRSA